MNSIAIQQVRDINELNMWQVQSTIDNLTTQYHDGQPIQLCASCDKRKDRQLTRENKFQQDVLVVGKMQQYGRKLVFEKKIIIFACLRKSDTDTIPPASYINLKYFSFTGRRTFQRRRRNTQKKKFSLQIPISRT